jgi:sarcosine oxidase
MDYADVVVVGLGAMGSATAWHLAQRGRRVIGLEQFAQGHDQGSSHGAARVFRLAYEQDEYVRLAVEALALWRTLEQESGSAILTQTGAVDYGTPAVLDRIGAALHRAGLATELLDPSAARRRWEGIAFDGPVLYSPDGGRTDADAARLAFQRSAAARGAELRFSTPVRQLRVTDDGVVARTDTSEVAAAVAVVTVNAWAPQLLNGLVGLPAIRVTQEQPAFFAPRDPGLQWPSFIRYQGDGTSASDFACYGLPSPTEGGVKVGEHGTGSPVDPDAPRPAVDDGALQRLSDYVARHIPGLDPTPIGATRCLYATTPTEDFVLDRSGPVVVGAGFSGHGFKFTPAIGRVLADLAEGVGPPPAERFRLPTFAP